MKKNNGITLIALIITIIVMLILVAVTINMAVNGGLFGYAGNAASQTRNVRNEELVLSDGIVGGKTIEYWVEGVESLLPNTTIPTGGVYLRTSTTPNIAYYSQITDEEKGIISELLDMPFNDFQYGGAIPPEGIQSMDAYLYGDYGYFYATEEDISARNAHWVEFCSLRPIKG